MEEPAVIKTSLKPVVAVLSLVLLFSLPLGAQTSGVMMQDEAKARTLSPDIIRVEAAINDVINNFSKGTFGVVQRAKGVYLPGYGISFACLINIHLAMVNTPFGVVARNEVTPEIKKQRIEELKNEMIRLLLDNGRGFQQLGREESVSITIFIEDRNIPDEPRANKSIVLGVPKKDLDELGQRNDRLKEFKQRVNILEY